MDKNLALHKNEQPFQKTSDGSMTGTGASLSAWPSCAWDGFPQCSGLSCLYQTDQTDLTDFGDFHLCLVHDLLYLAHGTDLNLHDRHVRLVGQIEWRLLRDPAGKPHQDSPDLAD